MDPLSVTGSVVGVISLGLQVASGLSNYLDGVKGRTEDLLSAKQQGDEMKNILQEINDLLLKVENNSPASVTLVNRHVKICETELSALYALLSKLSRPAPPGAGMRERAAEQTKKLTYPFNRSHITRLETRITKVNDALQTALQVAQLNISVASASQIRQLYDLFFPISQSQITQAQCASLTAACAVQQKIPSIVRPSDLVKVATSSPFNSPSLQSSSIEILQNRNTVQAADDALSQFYLCSCRQSRKVSYQDRSLGLFSFSYWASSTRRHLPDCPFSELNGKTQTTRLAMKYRGRNAFLQATMTLSFLNRQGAGETSLSPNLAYYPVVDTRTAPAFRIFNLAINLVWRIDKNDRAKHEDVMKTVQYCFKSILTLYSQKRASPREIDFEGVSLMHLVPNLVSVVSYRSLVVTSADMVALFIQNLIASGAPVTTYDIIGFTPSARLMHGMSRNSQSDGFIKQLLPEDPDMPLSTSRGTYYVNGTNPCLYWLICDSKVAEASGCGPLSLAAVSGHESLVQDLLKRDSEAIKEVNQFGHTPVHLSIKHPSCLRRILEAGGSSLLETGDLCGWTPLENASQLGYSESTQILLGSGSHITERSLSGADSSCISILLTVLKQRREELKVLALKYLTGAEAEDLGILGGKVLDGNASKVRELLLNKGIDVSLRLSTPWPWYAICYYEAPQSVHVSILDTMWTLGFRDVNSCGSYGIIPLMAGRPRVKVQRWFIEHGADYWTPFSERVDRTNLLNAPITPAHFMLCGMALTLWWKDEDERRAYQCTFEKLRQVQISDTCFSCLCFVGGCTPYKAFFDSCREPYNRTYRGLARWWLSCIRMLQTKLKEEELIAALRRITFDALGIKHTCCNLAWDWCYRKSLITQEEADEINSEQDSLLTLFSSLLTELNQIAYEDRGGTPLIISDPEEFWLHRWSPKIEETLQRLDADNLTEEERSAAEAVDVVWGPSRAKPTEIETRRDDMSPEYVMEEVARIMNE